MQSLYSKNDKHAFYLKAVIKNSVTADTDRGWHVATPLPHALQEQIFLVFSISPLGITFIRFLHTEIEN